MTNTERAEITIAVLIEANKVSSTVDELIANTKKILLELKLPY